MSKVMLQELEELWALVDELGVLSERLKQAADAAIRSVEDRQPKEPKTK